MIAVTISHIDLENNVHLKFKEYFGTIPNACIMSAVSNVVKLP